MDVEVAVSERLVEGRLGLEQEGRAGQPALGSDGFVRGDGQLVRGDGQQPIRARVGRQS